MSYNLWKSLTERDVDGFRQHLAGATYSSAPTKTHGVPAGGASLKVGSPVALATSPRASFKPRKSSGQVQSPANTRSRGVILSRADVNSRDSSGRTLLHHAASQYGEDAHDILKALLEIPFLDLYIQDTESGWTPLHRALYFGNVASAQALLQRDVRDATDYTTQAAHLQAGGLVKIKDNEGNSPFEVFGMTIAPRDIQADLATLGSGADAAESVNSVDFDGEDEDTGKSRLLVEPSVKLRGDEAFAFGSNKNLTLGTGDEDDRHFPERLQLRRPEHVLQRLYENHMVERRKASAPDDLAASSASIARPHNLPTLIRNKPVIIQDVVMSKLHTAVLTDDPISNLYICGFGPGGRLGTGDEITCFSYRCIYGGGLAKRRIASIALGQDHTIAICSQGEVYTWGSNKYGQLGYALPETSYKETPMQLLPRQLYGLVKREAVIGAAASSIHSVIFTAQSLYTFGKNEGQLGIMDADARSLETQILPRKVAPSVLQAQISAVVAIDRATAVLLETHEVIVFTHFGHTKVNFLDPNDITNAFLSQTLATRYGIAGNFIQKITAGANTLCAISSLGEVFTVDVPRVSETVPSNASTTNPFRARNALASTDKVWSIRKDHMSALDAAVSSQDGSIILCTTSGSVWRKEKRANIKATNSSTGRGSRVKDYKFVRVPNLTRAVAIRSNGFGAFVAVRRDCAVTREQIGVDAPSLWADLFSLFALRNYGDVVDDESSETPQLRFWRPATGGPRPALVKRALITKANAEHDITELCQSFEPLLDSAFDIWVTSNVTEVRIPVHSFVLKGRSNVLRNALSDFQDTYYLTIPDVMSIEYGADGQVQITFDGADFLTLVNLVIFMYTDEVVDVWHFTSKALQSAGRYRAVRVEVMKIANCLDLLPLERAARLMIDPAKTLSQDMEKAIIDPKLFSDADVIIELAEDEEQPAHSVLLCARCPFFEGLFNGRTGGMWMASRRGLAEAQSEVMRVDLKHIDARVFALVLRHLYADSGTELFDDIVTEDFDELADLVLDVMSAANELMIDRLAAICQEILGRFVNMRNVCGLLNAISECSVTEFKRAALEYICLNLEGMMEQRLLDELDPELLAELDDVVHQNQTAYMPFARSGRADAELLDRYPNLPELIEQAQSRRVDSMRLRSRFVDDEPRSTSFRKFRVGGYDEQESGSRSQRSPAISENPSPGPSPAISADHGRDDLPFEMDEDAGLGVASVPAANPSSSEAAHVDGFDQIDENQMGSPKTHTKLSRTPQNLGASIVMDPVADNQHHGTSPASEISRKPWQASPQVAQKFGFRDIMEQASTSRVSGLTQSLTRTNLGPAKPVVKVSQKERKKQQQQFKGKLLDKTSDVEAQNEAPSGKITSPWQSIKLQRQASDSMPARQTDDLPPSTPIRPGMTMRQTVAGARSSENVPQIKTDRSKSVPGTTPSNKAIQPAIQSIRHTPRPARPSALDGHTSLTDILSQQAIEKTSIKDAAAKRSLEEIQQEQEFQQWWDKESARVQEEAQAPTGSNQRGKSRRGRGGRGRGAARDMSGSGAKPQPAETGSSKATTSHPISSAERGRGGSSSIGAKGEQRGRGRGRGHFQ